MNEANIKSKLIFFKEVYFLFAFLTILITLYSLSGFSIKFKREISLEFLLVFFIHTSIYFGLKFRKKWVVNVILISSSYSLISRFLFSFQLSNEVTIIFYKLVAFIFLFFDVYQIYFFSKRGVKFFFKDRVPPLF